LPSNILSVNTTVINSNFFSWIHHSQQYLTNLWRIPTHVSCIKINVETGLNLSSCWSILLVSRWYPLHSDEWIICFV
jgi:hypothetical protein